MLSTRLSLAGMETDGLVMTAHTVRRGALSPTICTTDQVSPTPSIGCRDRKISPAAGPDRAEYVGGCWHYPFRTRTCLSDNLSTTNDFDTVYQET